MTHAEYVGVETATTVAPVVSSVGFSIVFFFHRNEILGTVDFVYGLTRFNPRSGIAKRTECFMDLCSREECRFLKIEVNVKIYAKSNFKFRGSTSSIFE